MLIYIMLTIYIIISIYGIQIINKKIKEMNEPL